MVTEIVNARALTTFAFENNNKLLTKQPHFLGVDIKHCFAMAFCIRHFTSEFWKDSNQKKQVLWILPLWISCMMGWKIRLVSWRWIGMRTLLGVPALGGGGGRQIEFHYLQHLPRGAQDPQRQKQQCTQQCHAKLQGGTVFQTPWTLPRKIPSLSRYFVVNWGRGLYVVLELIWTPPKKPTKHHLN